MNRYVLEGRDLLCSKQEDLYIVSYDISNDKRRCKLANFLSAYGIRVQKSVFQCHVKQKDIKSFIDDAEAILKDDESIMMLKRRLMDMLGCLNLQVHFHMLMEIN